MTPVVRYMKVALLGMALVIVSWSALDSPAAAWAVTCAASGHTCHAQLPDGTIIHAKEISAY